jgi:hypothetical protein
MNTPRIRYDEISDTLNITFESDISATGIELNDHILLRLHPSQQTPVSLHLFEYSVLAQPTELGTRSFPLTGLTALPHPLQEEIIEILKHPPLCNLLQLSAYTLSSATTVPIVSLQPTLTALSA